MEDQKMENIKQLINKAIKNGGLTLAKDLEESTEKKGFYVSMLGYEKTFKIEQVEEIQKTIKEYQQKIKNNKNVFIGLWIDSDLFYIDISKNYKNKQQAIKQGIKNKQLAIYDIEKNSNIYLTKNVYILYKYNFINNDIIYYKEYNTIKEIKKDFSNYSYNYLKESITTDIDNIKQLINNSYVIFKEKILINEV